MSKSVARTRSTIVPINEREIENRTKIWDKSNKFRKGLLKGLKIFDFQINHKFRMHMFGKMFVWNIRMWLVLLPRKIKPTLYLHIHYRLQWLTITEIEVLSLTMQEMNSIGGKTNSIPLTNRCIFSYCWHVIVTHKIWFMIVHVTYRYIYIAYSNKSTIVSLYNVQKNGKKIENLKQQQLNFLPAAIECVLVCIVCIFIYIEKTI